MTNETKRRIEYLKESLPVMQQKLMAAISMLIISLLITVTASYAWVSISVNPEARGMDTTISGNGSLEIALVSDDGSEPAKSAKGDSTASGNRLTAANETWGNLINLTDDSYGLSELILRPALLNTVNLKSRPLQGAVYGTDGRISGTSDKYMYTTWDGNEFVVPRKNNEYIDDFGVRAIASFKYTTAAATNATYDALLEEADAANREVEQNYAKAIDDEKIDALSGLMAAYVESQLNSSSEVEVTQYLGTMYNMYDCIYNAMLAQRQVFVKLANIQLFVDATTNNTVYTPVDWETVFNKRALYDSTNTTGNSVIKLTGLKQFCTDFTTLERDLGYLKLYYETTQKDSTKSYYWGSGGTSGYNISDMIWRMLQTNSITINGIAISKLASNIGEAIDMLGNQNNIIIVQDGILKRFESLAIQQNRINKYMSLNIKYSIFSVNAKGTVTTVAGNDPSYYNVDYEYSKVDTLSGKDPVAEDTYGMAVDMWLRSNESNTMLLLEGAVVTDESGTVIGYDGVNRVWNTTNDSMLSTNSTTQGSGSCYVFQASTPEDQARSLELLDCFKIAFVGANGEYYASASLDTENYYAKNGEVTVPLVVDANANIYEEDVNGNVVRRYGIKTLNKNEATWITALVYLDGQKITNEEVLINGELEGNLNIQFGSSANLVTKGSNVLEDETRTITAWVSKVEGGDKNTSITLDRAGEVAHVSLDVKAGGDSAEIETITGSFMRIINSTQGTKRAEITFTKQNDGTWISQDTFNEPGDYILQSVKVNGLVTRLEQSCSVEVKGYRVESLSWNENGESPVIVTTDKTHDTDLSMFVDASNMNNQQPTTATVRFLDESGNVVNAIMKYEASTNAWKGTAHFVSSGEYTLQYVLLDGEYYGVPSVKTLSLNMGVSFRIQSYGSPINIQYKEGEENKYTTDLKVSIYNDAGTRLSDLGYDMTLYYAHNGSQMEDTPMRLEAVENADYYTCSFLMDKIGTYSFHSLILKDESNNRTELTNAEYAQSFSLYPPEAPVYFKWEGIKWEADFINNNFGWDLDDSTGVRNQFTLSGNAKVKVYLKNAAASTARATFSYSGSEETKTSEFVAAGTLTLDEERVIAQTESGDSIIETNTYTEFVFDIPETEGKEGVWKLESIDLSDVFFDGALHTGTAKEDLYTLDLSAEDISGEYSSKVTATLSIEDTVQNDYVNFDGEIKETHVGTHRLKFNQDIGTVNSVNLKYKYNKDNASEYIIGSTSVSNFKPTDKEEVVSNLVKQKDGSYLIELPMTNPGEYTFSEMDLVIGSNLYVIKRDSDTKNLVVYTSDGETKSDVISMGATSKMADYKVKWNLSIPKVTIDSTNMLVDGESPTLEDGDVVMTGYYGYKHSINNMTVTLSNMPGTITANTVNMKYNGKNKQFTGSDGIYSTNNFTLNHSASCESLTISADNGTVNYKYTSDGVTLEMTNHDGSYATIALDDTGVLGDMPSFVEHVVAPTLTYSVDNITDTTSATTAVVKSEGNDVVLGKDASGNKVSLFMDEHKITSGINLTVNDNHGKTTTDAAVILTYYNSGDKMSEYGGYTTTDDKGKTSTVTATMTGSSGKYILDNSGLSLRTAGRYSLNKVEVTLNEVTYTYDSGGVSYTLPAGVACEDATSKASKAVVVNGGIQVHSATPYMEWTKVDPEGTVASTGKGTFGVLLSTHKYYKHENVISEDKHTAVVNFSVPAYTRPRFNYSIVSIGDITDGNEYYIYDTDKIVIPSLTATLRNFTSNYENASITFGDNDNIAEFVFGKESFSATVTIGKISEYQMGKLGYVDFKVLGTATSNILSVTYDKVIYEINVPTMTINHQY